MNLKRTTTMLAVASLGISAASAASLSINFTDTGPGMGNSDITELAGVVESGAWETIGSSQAIKLAPGNPIAMNDTNMAALRVDDGGTMVTTTATIALSQGFGGYYNTGGLVPSFNTGTALNNADMMSNFMEFDSATTIDFTNLNASVGTTYDVYVYMDRRYGNTDVANITIDGVTKFIEAEDNTGPFTEANYATAAAAQVDPTGGGNYVLFRGVTSDSLNIAFDSAGGTTGLNGIQIVGVPEPTSAALLGLGGLALILRRRK